MTLSVMSPKHGDLKVIWDPNNQVEVDHARETFNKMRKQGHAAYHVEKGGSKGSIMREFDPKAEATMPSASTRRSESSCGAPTAREGSPSRAAV